MNRPLKWLFFSRTCGAVGFHIFSVFTVLHAFEISPKLLTMGILGFSVFLGTSLTALIAGSVVDRMEYKGLYGLTVHVGVLMLALVSFLVPIISPIYLYGFTLLMSALRILRTPFYFVTSRHLADNREALISVSRWGSISWQAAGIAGPALAGGLSLVLGSKSLQIAYMLCFLMAAIGLLPFYKLRIPFQNSLRSRLSLKVWKRDFRESLQFFFSNRAVRDSFLIDTVGVLFAGSTAFLPFLLTQMQISPNYLGLIRAVQNLGSISAALFTTTQCLKYQTGKVFILSFLGFSVLTMLVPFVRNGLSLAFLFFGLGLLDGVSILIRDLLMLELSPSHLGGQVSALNSIFISSSDDLGEMESGLVGHLIGIPATAVLGGAMGLLLTGFLCTRSTDLWKFRLRRDFFSTAKVTC